MKRWQARSSTARSKACLTAAALALAADERRVEAANVSERVGAHLQQAVCGDALAPCL